MSLLKRNRFLQNNEKLFGALLFSLRKQIFVPDEITKEYLAFLGSATAMYSSVYFTLMKQQFGDVVEMSGKAWRVVNDPFVSRVFINPAIEREVFINSLFERNLPSGYTLSQRVWDLRRYSDDIAQVIRNGLVNNLSSSAISKQLDGFILPGRNVETLTPYGRTLNFDSMRLARSEVMSAFRRYDKEMMNKSPWVTGLRWELSGSHKDLCECDDLNGTVFSPTDVIPDAPHPQCACILVPEVMDNEQWDKALNDWQEYGLDDELGRFADFFMEEAA